MNAFAFDGVPTPLGLSPSTGGFPAIGPTRPAGTEGGVRAISILAETSGDACRREALLDRAMGPGRKRKSSEQLRRGRRPSEGLAFSARDGAGAFVGTVRLWDVAFGREGDQPRGFLMLGPLAVEPAQKGAGIGSALMRRAIAEASRLGHKAILLVGDPEYYARFGFSAEKTGGLAMPGPYERRRFLALEIEAGALDGARGVLRPAGRKIEATGMQKRAA